MSIAKRTGAFSQMKVVNVGMSSNFFFSHFFRIERTSFSQMSFFKTARGMNLSSSSSPSRIIFSLSFPRRDAILLLSLLSFRARLRNPLILDTADTASWKDFRILLRIVLGLVNTDRLSLLSRRPRLSLERNWCRSGSSGI